MSPKHQFSQHIVYDFQYERVMSQLLIVTVDILRPGKNGHHLADDILKYVFFYIETVVCWFEFLWDLLQITEIKNKLAVVCVEQSKRRYLIITSSNGNTFRVTGPLCVELTGDRWIPLTKTSDTDLRLNTRLAQTIKTPVI